MNKLFKLVKKRKDHVWKSDTILRCLGLLLVSSAIFFTVCLRDSRVFLIYLALYWFYTRIRPHHHNSLSFSVCVFFGIELLALSDDAIVNTLTPGNDYFVLVFMQLTLGQTQLIHKLMILPIYSLNHSIYLCKFCYNWNAWEIT